MSSMAFRRAVEARDLEAMVATLATDIVLHSPVTFKPVEGQEAVGRLFAIRLKTFEDFRYTDEFEGNGKSRLSALSEGRDVWYVE